MRKINFNKKRVIFLGFSMICMAVFFLRNSAFSSPFEYVVINGEEQLMEHNAKTDASTWSQTDYVNYLSLIGQSWSASDSLAITNAGPGATIQKWVCAYKNQYDATCNKSKEGIWVVTASGNQVTKLK